MCDARYPGIITIEYPLHRHSGRQFQVLGCVRYGRVAYYDVEADGGCVTVAAWMTRRDECVHLRWGFDPICSLAALIQLQTLLDERGS